MKLASAQHEAAAALEQAGVAEARREAALLLVMAIGREPAFLIAHPEYELGSVEEKKFREFIKRRSNREPLQYIRGHQEFYGLDFIVSPDVLIPRPETELLVENALEVLQNFTGPIICEVGIGSGCIAVSVLHANSAATAVGLDVSATALAIARTNAVQNGVANRIDLRVSDVFEAVQGEIFDIIISNPPYVPSEDLDSLQTEVRDFEPRMALTDGGDGFSIISRIVAESPRLLRQDGFLFLEIGFNQSHQVAEMFDRTIWKTLDILPDLQGIPRMVKAEIGSGNGTRRRS